MEITRLNVAVVGAAIGGSSLALLLARAGARVALFERVAQPRAIGAGIALAPNGLTVLRGLDLEPALRDRGRPLSSPRIVDDVGRTLLAPRLPPRDDGLDHLLVIRRSDLHRVLLDAATEHDRIALHLGVEITDVTADASLRARHDVDDTWRSYDLVVGADGVRSSVREHLDVGARMRASGITYVRTLTAATEAEGVEAWTRAGIFGSLPLPDGAYLYASAGSPALRDALAARDLDALRRAWEAAYPPAGRLLGGVARFEDLLLNEVVRVDCERFVDGRVALLGDAAHAMAPNLGQGANSALVDAAVLLGALRDADDVESALVSYDARRRPAVRWVQDQSDRLGRISERSDAAWRTLRDRLLMPAISRFGPDPSLRTYQESLDALLDRSAPGPARPTAVCDA